MSPRNEQTSEDVKQLSGVEAARFQSTYYALTQALSEAKLSFPEAPAVAFGLFVTKSLACYSKISPEKIHQTAHLLIPLCAKRQKLLINFLASRVCRKTTHDDKS